QPDRPRSRARVEIPPWSCRDDRSRAPGAVMTESPNGEAPQSGLARRETASALRRRGWAIFARGAVGFFVVNGVNAFLGHVVHGGFVAVILAIILLAGFALFFSALWSYAGHVHVRFVLHRNPWREAKARAIPIGIADKPIACVVELGEGEFCAVRPLRWARTLP